MDMSHGFLQVLEKPKEKEQPTISRVEERIESCPICLQPVDLRADYDTVVVEAGGRRMYYHLFPCFAGPEECNV